MKRHPGLLVAAAVAVVALAAFAAKQPATLLVLEWAAKAPAEKPPLAILIELGLNDKEPTDWSGQATVSGATVVHREGYRFRKGDTLVDKNGWKASSRRPIRVPAKNPAVVKMEGIATVGLVLHLSDVQPEATLTVAKGTPAEKAVAPLKGILGGKAEPIWNGAAVVRLVSTASPVVTASTEDDFPAAAYGPDGTLWVAYISYTLKDESRRIEQHALNEQPADFKALYTPEFGDQLFVKYFRQGNWHEPIPITGPTEDLVRCAIAVEGNGTVWVAYSANRNGNYDVYARPLNPKAVEQKSQNQPLRPGPEQRLTDNPGPDLNPSLQTDSQGQIWLTCQSRNPDGTCDLFLRSCSEGKWKDSRSSTPLSSPRLPGNAWQFALAAGPGKRGAVAYDIYRDGHYGINLLAWDQEGLSDSVHRKVVDSSRYEARPSACYDAYGRLWIAYEEGPERWGKDYGALDSGRGEPLYSSRSVRVVCLQDGKLYRPEAELPTSKVAPPSLPFGGGVGNQYEKAPRYAYPKIGIDGKGRVWLTYRQKFGSRYSTHPGSYWLTFARRLDGDKWSEPIEVHHSDGLLDYRPVLLPHASGGLRIIHNTDGRYTTPETIDNQIYMSYVDLPGEPVDPKLVPHIPGTKNPELVKEAAKEQAAVERIRGYRVEAGGKKYQLLRGEFHRHTEISWDGGPDGSLEDMFRYAIDAAAMDWIGNGDHDNGAGREYPWWLTQKLTDAYHVGNHFTPLFCYERSVAYPHGHRNCLFARRGVRTLPRLAEPEQKKRVGAVHADDTKMLYRYLHEMDGICASHTSATSMGTDWRDNDGKVEPIVEIYQGDRMSYEYEGAPRAGYDPKSKKEPANVAGWYPLGYVNLALKDKNYRLGFESSSDHWSTHISYCIAVAERHDRDSILSALKKRHCYGATDDIIADVRSGSHLMGDEFTTNAPPALQMTVVGTSPIARIDILKDSKVVDTIKPAKERYEGSWTDPKPGDGMHYYYVRVQQSDGELAWTSPMWIDYAK